MGKFTQITAEKYNEVTTEVKQKLKPLLDYIYREHLVTVETLLEKFPEIATVDIEMLTAIGAINGYLYPKFNVALYPAEVGATMKDSAFSLGTIN